ncbi:MAG: RluA family pseudouridine synthase [Clostridia bacterium]|nr:RluA family pseudouridine synthase [Clostridia bacterium]
MKEFVISKKDDGKRLDKWLIAELPLLTMGLREKYIRLKRIKVNGKGAQRDTRLKTGDVLNLYINDEYFEKPKKVDPFLSKIKPRLNILYEDENIMLVDKHPGFMVHPDGGEKVNTLISHVQAYLYQKGEYDSMDNSAFAPALCNRIDRFTGGIVIVAKTETAMRILNQKIRDREIEKHYLCIIHGKMRPASGKLHSYISKAESKHKVTVLRNPAPGAQEALTGYETLAARDNLSLMHCELFTGRTHQIRAQFAFAGHPLLGDNQYGSAKQNEKYGRSYQALYAWKLVFSFETDAGELNYLNGKCFEAPDVRFVQEYFPEYRIEK